VLAALTAAALLVLSLGGLVAYVVVPGAPARVERPIVASADAHRPPGRESVHPVTLADKQSPRSGW
jgi:hypothetical protein